MTAAEGQIIRKEIIKQNTDSPHVHCVIVPAARPTMFTSVRRTIFYNLRCHKTRGSTEICTSMHSRVWVLNIGRHAKVSNFNLHVFAHKNVVHLQISMHDALSMHQLHRTNDLKHDVAHFHFTKEATMLNELDQAFVGAIFKHQVHIIIVLKRFNKLCKVLVLERPLDFDLLSQLLFVFPTKFLFVYFLECVDLFSLRRYLRDLENCAVGSFSKEFSFKIFVSRVGHLNFLSHAAADLYF